MNRPSPEWRQLLGAFRDFRQAWPQLLITHLLSLAIGILVLTPLVGVLLKVFLARTQDGVLADADILMFLLHPTGMAALMVIGTVSLGMLFIEQGFLMVIGFGAAEQRRVTWLDAVLYVGKHAYKMVTLAGHVLLRLLLTVIPFLVGVGCVYLIFLTEHDINFYLADKPPEWWWAVAWASVILATMAIVMLRLFAGWILSLPLVLFEEKHGRQALQQSKADTAPYRWKIASLLAAWLAGILLLSFLITYMVNLVGAVLIPDISTNLTWVAAGFGATLVLSGGAYLGLNIITTVMFALFTVRLFRLIAGPGQFDPELVPRGSLGEKDSHSIPGKSLLWLGGTALLLIMIGGYLASRSMGSEVPVEIIAHRGASGAAPENTMAAFHRAIEDKADWIELDVQESADDIVVVAHDSDFMKVAGNGTKVWEATGDKLRNIDIGSWFGKDFYDQRVPTLREALELAKGKLGVVIELKYYGHDRNLESRVVDVVEETAMAANVKIMSLKLPGLQKSAALRPDWPHGLLNTASIGDLTHLDLDFLALNAVAASRAMIHSAHKQGMKIYVWTINDPIQMSVMMSRGVDGIITDEPGLVTQVMKLRELLSPIGRLLVWIAGESGLLRGVDKSSSVDDA